MTEQQRETTTWDGRAISPEPPYGATIVVYRRSDQGLEFLVLHRQHEGPAYEGDWAWGAPSGARLPGEPIDACAARELAEETGLHLALRRTDAGTPEWSVYVAEAPRETAIILSDEHDRHAWLPADAATACMAPQLVRNGFQAAILPLLPAQP